MPKVSCNICAKIFYAKPCHIKRGDGKFCSMTCATKGRRRGKFINCTICNKQVWKQPKALLHSKSGKFFCGKSCQTVWRNTIRFIGPEHPNWKGGEYTYRYILRRSNVLKICKNCGLNDTRLLSIHHIDKNHKNNNLKNLVYLCYNCHFLIHHDKTEFNKFMEALV